MGKSDSSGTGQHDLPVQGWSHLPALACYTGAFNSGLLIWKVQITSRATIRVEPGLLSPAGGEQMSYVSEPGLSVPLPVLRTRAWPADFVFRPVPPW